MFKDAPLNRLYRTLTTENLWLYILSLLSKKGKIHGYTLSSEIKKKFGWEPGFITPYVVLYKLEAEGFITSKIYGRRRYYVITKKGRKAITEAKSLLKKIVVSL